LFGASTTTSLGFNSGNQIVLTLAGTAAVTTTAVYRDPSSWYHIVYTQNGSAQTIYVNGTSVGTGTTANTVFNTAIAHQIAAANTTNYFDGYLAEVNFVDGQALTPSSFGVTGPNSVWQPSLYSGSYGTNGFYLKFASFGTAAALGTDSSGNGNTWTVNNISITTGTTYDPMLDVPTLTSATVANFATFNPLQPHDSGYTTSVTNGNMAVSITYSSGGNMVTVPSTIKTLPSGQWYWEVTVTSALAGGTTGVGVITPDSYVEGANPPTTNYLYIQSGNKFTNGTSTAYGATFTNGDVIGVALDVGAGTITFYKNNVSQGTAFTGLSATSYYAVVTSNATGTRSYAINFGQRPFSYTPPSGYVALNAYNLSAGTVTTSGSFTGNALADGPFVWLNGTPTAMTINGNAVTFGTQADKLANGFKVRTTSTSYNSTGSNTYSVSTTGAQFKYQIAQENP
jgi:hypothetical protein